MDRPIIASWADVRNKARRLRQAGAVKIVRIDPDIIVAKVEGDHNVYDVELYRQYPNSWKITIWYCTCAWGQWAWKRQITYVGRMCSHALSTLFEAHSREYKKDSPDKRDLRNKAASMDDREARRHRKQRQKKDWSAEDDYVGWWKNQKPIEPKEDKEPWDPKFNKDFDYGFDFPSERFGPSGHKYILKTVWQLKNLYPVTNGWFRGIHVSNYNTHAPCCVGDGRLWLPSSYADKPDKWDRKTVAHEFGHALHTSIVKHEAGHVTPFSFDDLLNEEVPTDPETAKNLGGYKDRQKGTVNIFNTLGDERAPITHILRTVRHRYTMMRDWPSSYAETVRGHPEHDHLEMFAENMRDWWLSHDPKPTSKHIGGYVDWMYHKDSPMWNEFPESRTSRRVANQWLGWLREA